MQKVLVVEDERLVRSDIVYKVSRSGLNFQWVMEAASAEEALEIIEKNKPDILLTDIIMGAVSGIDLIRQANVRYPEMVSIIICGHPDFHFAQEAIDLNVTAYLLKPVRADQLTDALQKAALRILKQRDTNLLAVKSDLLKQKLADRELHKELYAFLNGFQDQNTVSLSSLFPEDACYFQAAILHTNKVSWDKSGVSRSAAEERELLRYAVRNIAQEIGKGYLLPFKNPANNRQIIMILATPEKSRALAHEHFLKTARRLHQELARNLHLCCFIGLSAPSEGLSVICLEQAKQMLDLRLCLSSPPAGQVFDYQSVSESYCVPEMDFKLYQKLLDCGDLPNILKLIAQFFQSLKGIAPLNPRLIYMEIICILARSCFTKGMSVLSILGSEGFNGSIIDTFSDMDDLIFSLSKVFTTALDQWVGKREGTVDILRHVKQYIEDRFSDPDLCTTELAERFCISSGYLSASYKKNYGTTISKYIMDLRIAHARHLLCTTQLPIYLISENSGFNNVSYFMRTFKKYQGCTCGQCREQPPVSNS